MAASSNFDKRDCCRTAVLREWLTLQILTAWLGPDLCSDSDERRAGVSASMAGPAFP